MINLPPDILSQTQKANWLRKLLRGTKANTVCAGRGVRVTQTPWGAIVSSYAGNKKSIRAEMFKLVSVQGDYITCHFWDGTTEGTDDVYIAKPYKLRQSVTKEAKFGVVHTFTYATEAAYGSNNVVRTDRNETTSSTERQLVTPPWCPAATINVGGTDHVCPAEIIYAIECFTGVEDGDGETIDWLHVSPSRQWAKI